jgi:hypothetical protein
MIQRLNVKNFRGLERAEIDLAPITVLIGANNAGKSTVAYALFTLKSILSNPAQPLESFFNLGFINLGGFKQAVFAKDEERSISLWIKVAEEEVDASYGMVLGKHVGTLNVGVEQPFAASLSVDVTFPYSLTQTATASVHLKGHEFQVTWNGLIATATAGPTPEADSVPRTGGATPSEVAKAFSVPAEEIRKIDMEPLKRGFSKPVYSAVAVPAQLLTEDEVATVLASDPDLLNRVDRALEQVLNRSLRVFTTPGTATFFLHSVNRENGMTTELVNEGFGTNQLVFLLAKTYRTGISTVCVEEPEIHLHPSAISRLVRVLATTAKHPLTMLRRQFVITTHSEHFVTALLGLVAEGVLSPQDVALYYVSRDEAARDGFASSIERSEVSAKGQVKGGLRGFYEAELAAARVFLGTDAGD